MDKKYKVITLSISGKGNKIFRNGEIITKDQVNNFEDILKQGGLEEVVSTDKAEEIKKPIKK